MSNKRKETKKVKKLLILKGEGRHEHVLDCEDGIVHETGTERLSEIHVGKGGVLTHVDPLTNKPAEHNAIPIEEGTWLIGRQVELNPFDNTVSGVFD